MSAPSPLGQPAGAWVCVFAEEFTGPLTPVGDPADGYVTCSPGGPTWRQWYPEWAEGSPGAGAHANNPANGSVYYDPSAVTVSGGMLHLTARAESTFPGLPYTAGMLQSDPAFTPTFGYSEARIRVDQPRGFWPAFWMAGAAAYDVNSDEFDTFEQLDGYGDHYIITTWRNGSGGMGGDLYGKPVAADMSKWHTYGCAWTPDALRFYLDGVEVARDTNPADVPQRPMYLLLDVQVHKDTRVDADYPAVMDVDWVRFYKAAGAPSMRLGEQPVAELHLAGQQVSPSLFTA